MNLSAIIIDDDSRLYKIKAALESLSINVFIASNLYELISKVYKYDIKILLFNPDIVWINIMGFISEIKKLPNFYEFKIYFLHENIDADLKKEAEKHNIICIKYSSNINELAKKIIFL